MDALEELKKALDKYQSRGVTNEWMYSRAAGALCGSVEVYLPSLLAELEARRAQAGDIPNAAGFTPSATRAMR